MEHNVLIRFLKKIFHVIIDNNLDNIINYQDDKNQLVGFKILNSEIKQEYKIILFNYIKEIIDPLEINLFLENKNNNYNFPIIFYSVLLNEYEITFILLKFNKDE